MSSMTGNQTIKHIVHGMFALIALELAGKIYCNDEHYWLLGGLIFIASYTCCILTDILGMSNLSCVKSPVFRGVLSILHGLDGLAALAIGISIYYRNKAMLMVGLLAMTKFFLIHLLNRMILAKKKTDNIFDGLTQTTKSFLHHVASFIFLRHPTEIIITTVWRTISMSGHAALVLRDKLSPKSMHNCHWGLAYLRISFQILLLTLCLTSPSLRFEFAHSAVGHVAYMAVRLEPVFQQGSMYLSADEKEEWTALSSSEKVAHLWKGHHPWLALELVLLSALVTLLTVLRLQLMLAGEFGTGLNGRESAGALHQAGHVPAQLGSQDYLRWFLSSMAQ